MSASYNLFSWQSPTLPKVRGKRFLMGNIQKQKKSQISLRLDLERKTRLELATPTLARLCSTN